MFSQNSFNIKRFLPTEASDGELPLEPDSDEREDDTELTNVNPETTTRDLVEKTKRAGNIRSSQVVSITNTNTRTSNEHPHPRKRKSNEGESEIPITNEISKKKLRNSDLFPSSVRPDWLKEDKTINSLPRATVANVIAQSQMTEAINRQIKMKEDKADKSKGGLRKDEDVKTITVKEGDDNATNILHPQRFSLRPPLLKPESYWDLVPVKWPETNKRLQLAHLGLDHVISARTKEVVHDRSDVTINIKMFSPINVMVGREGDSMTSRFKHESGGVKVEMLDKWADITTIGQLDEALDNLVRLWSSVWPFDYGPSNIKGVLSKHRNFAGSFDNMNTRKKILEDFINRTLGDNAVRAGQKLPPLTFKEVDDRAKEVMDRKADYNRVQNRGNLTNNNTQQNQNQRKSTERSTDAKSAFTRLQTFLKTQAGSDDLCIWFNLKEGCQTSNCPRKHLCCKLPTGQKGLCRENHAMFSCKKK